jgi:hypothetical protein
MAHAAKYCESGFEADILGWGVQCGNLRAASPPIPNLYSQPIQPAVAKDEESKGTEPNFKQIA